MAIIETVRAFGEASRNRALERLVTPEIEALVARMPKPVGSFGYDPWGYNEHQAKIALAVCKRFYDHYFRVTATGLENIPASGRALIVANHGGQLPVDGVMIVVAAATNPHGPRVARAMVERFLPTVPWVGSLLWSCGCVIGDPHNASRMLESEELLVVFPEGVRGSGKPYRRRYQLQRFGHGFMHLALAHKVPIIPAAVIGSEETMPSAFNLWPLARLLGLPYFPVGPLLPLPARISLHFGEPMHFSGCVSREDEVAERVETVKQALRGLIAQGLKARSRVF